MRRLIFLAAFLALAVARPELYKEKEDFQFSRSSSDDGSKSGFYGAQRGNMGGNYERAHNMDTLAQHQMGGLVSQVEGELGDGSKTRTGSVYSSANSRGIYGSGRYDLRNLEGRNFQEGSTYDDTQSLTSHNSGNTRESYSALNSAGYGNSHTQGSRYRGYQAAGYSEQTSLSSNQQSSNLQTNNLQSSNNLERSRQYDYDRRAAHNTGYQSQSGVHGQGVYDQSDSNLHSSSGYDLNAQHRYIATPVRIIVTPGTRVAIPVAQNYDASLVSSHDQTAVNSDAEVLHGNDQQTIYRSSNEPKHYESSYKYRKEWEKHDTKPVTVPLAVPTVYPFPKNSELYEDTQGQVSDRQFETNGINSHSSNAYSGYKVNSASSSQSRRQSNFDAQHQISSSGTDSNAYTNAAYNSGAAASLTNPIENSNTRPKSYQSSYSYHKSWERQGDPYVIKPASNGLYDGQSSQKLTAEQNQGAYASHQHGSHYHQSHQRYASSSDDCDESGHIRVARSYRVAQNQEVNPYQQSQNIDQGQEDLGQQTQNGWQNYEDLGQQSQREWNNIENLGQQPQNKWDNLEDLGQQTQNKWDKIEDLGQQPQNKWDNLEDLGQQTQNKWDKIEDLGQQTQNQFDQQDLRQEPHNTWNNLELSQQSQTNVGQQTQDTWSIRESEPKEHIGEQTFEIRDNMDNLRQQTEDQRKDKEAQSLNIYSQHEQSPDFQSAKDEHMRPQEILTNSNTANQDIQTTQQDNFASGTVEDGTFEHPFSQREDLGQQTQDSWNNFEQNTYNAIKPMWGQTTDNTEQIPLNAHSGMNTDENMFSSYNRGYSKPWVFDQTQHHHDVNFNQQTQTHATNYWTAHTGFQPQNSWQEVSSSNHSNFPNSQFHSTSASPLSSLWNKIDRIEKQFLENNDSYHTQSSQDSYHNLEQVHTVNNSDNDFTQTLQINNISSNTGNVPKPSNTFITSTTETPKDERILHHQDKLRPLDVGRGDIGPEDSSTDISMTEKSFNLFNDKLNSSDKNKTYKTAAEIESLSLINESNINNKLDNKTQNTNEYYINQNNYQTQNNNEEVTEINSESTVLSLNQQKRTEDQKSHELSSSSTRAINKHVQIVNGERENKKNDMLDDKIDLNGKQNLEKQDIQGTSTFTFDDIQHNRGLNQNPIEIEPQSMDQQFEGFRESNGNYNQLNLHRETEKLGEEKENLNQQNMEQQFEHFGQQSENFDQESQDFGQRESFGNQNEGFKHSSEQLENQFDFGQQNENLDQQSQTAWNDNLEDQIQTVAKPNKYLQQEPDTDLQQSHHQLEIFEQQSENLDQQSQNAWNEKLEDLNQQVQPVSIPNNILQPDIDRGLVNQLVITEQQNQNLDQQSLTEWNEKLDLNQQVQTVSQLNNNFPQTDPQQAGKIETRPDIFYKEHRSSTLNEQHNSQNAESVQSVTRKNIVVESPPEPATEKPGFWNSVGTKFVSAKDKVLSWFGSS